jgi:hypothetical protein
MNRACLALIFSVLLGWQSAFAQSSASADQRQTLVRAVALKKLGIKDLKSCIVDFKRGMNDPASFQWVDPKDVTVRARSYELSEEDKQTKIAAKYPPQFYMDGWDDSAFLETPVRGKNAYGGLVLACLVCAYNYDDAAGFSYVGALSEDGCLPQ